MEVKRVAVREKGPEGFSIEDKWLLRSDPERPPGEHLASVVPRQFRQGRPGVFAVAGPVFSGRARLTNLPWEVSEDGLVRDMGLRAIRLINDVEAMAWSLTGESPENLRRLGGPPVPRPGHRVLLSLGTGLGGGGLFFDGKNYHPWSGEPGHATWAPRGREDLELLDGIDPVREGVRREDVLSGRGLVRIALYCFSRSGRDFEAFTRAAGGEDPAAVINRRAGEGDGPCREAVRIFLRILGAEMGGLVLTTGARGGCFLGGGMALRLAWALGDPVLMESFLLDGPMRGYLEQVPLFLLKDEDAPISGALRLAQRLWGGGR